MKLDTLYRVTADGFEDMLPKPETIEWQNMRFVTSKALPDDMFMMQSGRQVIIACKGHIHGPIDIVRELDLSLTLAPSRSGSTASHTPDQD